ncbi:MAG: diadenylate cyclase CdaA [Eubacteriales bacterium]|nr:diadenylate cyclase CdaA [Eubacteriales bacterium]
MFAQFAETIQYYISNYGSYFRLQDVFDILIVAYIFYKVIGFIRETRAMQLVKGIGFLVVIMLVSEWLEFYTINYILRNTLQVGVLALVVIFQPELRRVLEKVGTATIRNNLLSKTMEPTEIKNVCDEVSRACSNMSSTKTGCLVVFERTSKLGDIVNSGVKIDSVVSEGLLVNIFVPNTPLHDGAVVIRDGRVHSAACVLPLTQNPNLDSELGTRHRAGIGMSENSDAVVVIVSEETGKISLAVTGKLTRNLTEESLRKALRKLMMPEEEDNTPKTGARKFMERKKASVKK